MAVLDGIPSIGQGEVKQLAVVVRNVHCVRREIVVNEGVGEKFVKSVVVSVRILVEIMGSREVGRNVKRIDWENCSTNDRGEEKNNQNGNENQIDIKYSPCTENFGSIC